MSIHKGQLLLELMDFGSSSASLGVGNPNSLKTSVLNAVPLPGTKYVILLRMHCLWNKFLPWRACRIINVWTFWMNYMVCFGTETSLPVWFQRHDNGWWKECSSFPLWLTYVICRWTLGWLLLAQDKKTFFGVGQGWKGGGRPVGFFFCLAEDE